jgi:hypothetical protein
MNDAARVGQVLHQQAGSASMIEVNMRQEDKVHVTDVEILLSQPIEKKGHAGVRAGIDKGSPAALNNEVTRVLQRPEILRIDGKNAIIERGYMCVTSQAWWSRGP